jgi:hypothetical protein
LKRIEAIARLAACIPLAQRLAYQGVNIELTEADRAALEGFHEVWLYEDGWWLDDNDIHRQAGLGRDDIGALTFMLARVQAEEMRRQHESGEQLE